MTHCLEDTLLRKKIFRRTQETMGYAYTENCQRRGTQYITMTEHKRKPCRKESTGGMRSKIKEFAVS